MVPDLPKWAKIVRRLRKRFSHILTDEISTLMVEKGGFGGDSNYHQSYLRCHSAESFLFISHDGFLKFPCKIHPIMSISALKYPLKTILNTIEVREIMDKHDSYEFCDGCRLGCAIAASITSNWEAIYEKFIKGFMRGNLR